MQREGWLLQFSAYRYGTFFPSAGVPSFRKKLPHSFATRARKCRVCRRLARAAVKKGTEFLELAKTFLLRTDDGEPRGFNEVAQLWAGDIVANGTRGFHKNFWATLRHAQHGSRLERFTNGCSAVSSRKPLRKPETIGTRECTLH